MRLRLAVLIALGALAGVGWSNLSAHDRSNGIAWMRVARDSSYDIAIDTTRLVRLSGRVYEVWYRTDHAVPRYDNARTFDREVVQGLLECPGYSFKIARVDMSLNGRLVARQREGAGELGQQPWRKVEAGTIEADVAGVTCDFARHHARARHG